MTRWQDAHGPTWNGLDTELSPGQSWAIPAGPQWQARLDRAGRAHVIGRALASDNAYRGKYGESRVFGRKEAPAFAILANDGALYAITGAHCYGRRWHADFERACRAASYHERLVIAAKRQAAQSGQGGE
jgi:hypothetical protein